jgi:hypothetical protein
MQIEPCKICDLITCRCPKPHTVKDDPVIKESPDLTMRKDKRDAKNRQLLVDLMAQYNITIPARQFDNWRPTEPTRGYIEGVAEGLTCIMTDGLLGYFIRDERGPLLGHMTHFQWTTAVEMLIPYMTPEGERKMFKVIKDSGVPSTFHRLEPDPNAPMPTKKPRKPVGTKSARQALIDSL